MKTILFSILLALSAQFAMASQEFAAIKGTATPNGDGTYKVSGQVVDVSAGLNLAETQKVALSQLKIVAPPHLAVAISSCQNGMGTLLVQSMGGDILQPNSPSELSEGWDKNVVVLFQFTCSAN